MFRHKAGLVPEAMPWFGVNGPPIEAAPFDVHSFEAISSP